MLNQCLVKAVFNARIEGVLKRILIANSITLYIFRCAVKMARCREREFEVA